MCCGMFSRLPRCRRRSLLPGQVPPCPIGLLAIGRRTDWSKTDSRGELARGRRTALAQRPVEPEPFAQIDGVELECPGGVAKEARSATASVGSVMASTMPRGARTHLPCAIAGPTRGNIVVLVA